MNKNLIELCDKLFHKDNITGFQFTVDTKRGLMIVSLNKPNSVVIDLIESKVTDEIGKQIFGHLPNGNLSGFSKILTTDQINLLQNQFCNIGFVEAANGWLWLRITCKYNEIPTYVEKLKTIKI